MATTIICCTDNSCPPDLFTAAMRCLGEVAEGMPIVCVSHYPVQMTGDYVNYVVGPHKRSWLTLYRQLAIGLNIARTENVAICEHDCFYTKEHLTWQPPKDDTFYYNDNVWLVQWSDDKHADKKGMYSTWRHTRLALSQLICNRELYLNTLERRLRIIDQDHGAIGLVDQVGEPGVSKINVEKARQWADSGRPVYLKDYLGEILELERYETFKTLAPNLDVRHGSNFTGPRRGTKRRYRLNPWGAFADVMGRYGN